ncbi:MAG: P-type conjugative transfer ATPase TrbB [Deltaproteobacteria bacterium]|nr:P-type conjugative transfer ATPase TrbB [Deltaproteobacteria bacterium]
MLATALGDVAGGLLLDDSIIELMLNPDGKLWIDRLGHGRSFTGHMMTPADAERVIFIVASSVGLTCNKDTPILSAELPRSGSRFQGILPPIVQRPTFTIRKKAVKIFTLEDYISQEILRPEHADIIRHAIVSRKNILIAGGTGSGKTTLTNAILNDIAATQDRVVIIEDTQELQCNAEDCVSLRTKEGCASMADLLRATMRLRPDRIVIGEVRGPEALALLKAWNTGHPGGCATLHADSAERALSRLEQLVFEAGISSANRLIAEAVNLIVFIEKYGVSRQVREVLALHGVTGDCYQLERL